MKKLSDLNEREKANQQFDREFSNKMKLDILVDDWIQSIRNLNINNSHANYTLMVNY